MAFRGLCVAGSVLVASAGVASGQLRVVNYNIARLQGNQTNLQDVFAALRRCIIGPTRWLSWPPTTPT